MIRNQRGTVAAHTWALNTSAWACGDRIPIEPDDEHRCSAVSRPPRAEKDNPMAIPLFDLTAFRHRQRPLPVFVRGPEERPLQILIDGRFLDPVDPATRQLLEFVHHPLVDMVGWESPGQFPHHMTVAATNEPEDHVLLDVTSRAGNYQLMIWPYRQWRDVAHQVASERGTTIEKVWPEILLARA
jgi:hypothetical protein